MTRTWYEDKPDRKAHTIVRMTDEEALARLERGEQWLPFILGGKAAVAREFYVCDGSGVRITDNQVDGLCPTCEGLGCAA